MLGLYWSISFNILNLSTLSSKSSSSENQLSLNEVKQGQGELIDNNVLFSEMLCKIRMCDMSFIYGENVMFLNCALFVVKLQISRY